MRDGDARGRARARSRGTDVAQGSCGSCFTAARRTTPSSRKPPRVGDRLIHWIRWIPSSASLELRSQIRHHEERYYIQNEPEISDEAFDRLLHELERLEAEHPDLVTADSPTQRVAGRPIEGFETVEHLAPMLSLDNAYDEAELQAFDERVRRGAGLGTGPSPTSPS